MQAWLINEQLSPMSESPLRKKRRQSNVKSVSKFLLDRSNASTNADNNSSTDDFEAELAKITKGKQKVNREKRNYGIINSKVASIFILKLWFFTRHFPFLVLSCSVSHNFIAISYVVKWP